MIERTITQRGTPGGLQILFVTLWILKKETFVV
jgi:hypothetical protein